MLERDLYCWPAIVLRNKPTAKDIDDYLFLPGRLSISEKKSFWLRLSQSDPNLKTWLKRQGQIKKASMAAATTQGGRHES